jgi:hypothetical protein
MLDYSNALKKLNITISYNGPLWSDGIKGIAEMVKTSLSHEDLPGKASKTIFSVFVEQVTNMLMYSAEKERFDKTETEEASTGMLVLGHKDNMHFIQTGNTIKNESVEFVKNKIEHLNSLDKKELRQYHREAMRSENENPESKGGGLGLIEIARRVTGPIVYNFEPIDEWLSYFTMYVEIAQEAGE